MRSSLWYPQRDDSDNAWRIVWNKDAIYFIPARLESPRLAWGRDWVERLTSRAHATVAPDAYVASRFIEIVQNELQINVNRNTSIVLSCRAQQLWDGSLPLGHIDRESAAPIHVSESVALFVYRAIRAMLRARRTVQNANLMPCSGRDTQCPMYWDPSRCVIFDVSFFVPSVGNILALVADSEPTPETRVARLLALRLHSCASSLVDAKAWVATVWPSPRGRVAPCDCSPFVFCSH